MRRAALLLAVTAAALGASVAAAQAPPLAARTVACETGPQPADRFAVFSGSLPRDGAAAMGMRFDLYERLPGGSFRRVRLPRWGIWERTARQGVPGFIFTKRVRGLAAPAAFRAVVSFRWYDADGRVVRSARRTTPTCRQPDWRPDLHVLRVVVPADGSPTSVVVANRGRGAAAGFGVDVRRADVLRSAVLPGLPAGGQATVSVPLGRCRPGETVTVTLDPGDRVDEAHEADNVAAVACPGAR
jgi:hypothetical protein